jgi:hypothetical protein
MITGWRAEGRAAALGSTDLFDLFEDPLHRGELGLQFAELGADLAEWP